MKTIIAGCRSGVDLTQLFAALELIDWQISEVVSGGATGADTLGEYWAKAAELPLKKFPADWNTHGKAAGSIRNRQMAEYADALIALWDGKSRGTANMIKEATSRGLKICVYRIDQK